MNDFNTVYNSFRDRPECVTSFTKLKEFSNSLPTETLSVINENRNNFSEVSAVPLYKVYALSAKSIISKFHVSKNTKCFVTYHLQKESQNIIPSLPGSFDDYKGITGVSRSTHYGNLQFSAETEQEVLDFQKDKIIQSIIGIQVDMFKRHLSDDYFYKTNGFLDDCGMGPNNCNNHLVFTDRKVAEEYLETCKNELSSRGFSWAFDEFDHDYAYDDYDDYDYDDYDEPEFNETFTDEELGIAEE